jgi:sec-independent protein translocase protein TatC
VDRYFHIKNVLIVTTSPFQFVDLAVSTGIFIAILTTLPFIFLQIFSFLRTGLTPKEKKKIVFYIPLIFILFVLGFLYGFASLYYSVNAVAQINLSLGIQNFWDISQFLSQIVVTAALLGVLFQFPLLLTLLISMGIMNVGSLKAKRRHAILAIYIITSLLPPTDGVSLIVMTVPLMIMYETTIWFNAWITYSKYLVIN